MKQKKYKCYAAVSAAVILVIFILTLLMRFRLHLNFSKFSQYSLIQILLYCMLGFFSARMFLDFFKLAERYVLQILTGVYAFLFCLAVSLIDRGLCIFRAGGNKGAYHILTVVLAFGIAIVAAEMIDLTVSEKKPQLEKS